MRGGGGGGPAPHGEWKQAGQPGPPPLSLHSSPHLGASRQTSASGGLVLFGGTTMVPLEPRVWKGVVEGK